MAISAAQAKRDRKALHKAIAHDLKRQARAKVKELREAVRVARAGRKALHERARARCRAERAHVRARAEQRRQRALAELRAATQQERKAAHFICHTAKATAKTEHKGHVERARATLSAERQYQADLRRIEAANRAKKPGLARARVRRSESNDEVRQNLDPDMLALFEKVRRQITGSDRQSRTEAFLAYAHDHPKELLGALDDLAEQKIRELEREHRKAHRFARKRYSAAELDAVPF